MAKSPDSEPTGKEKIVVCPNCNYGFIIRDEQVFSCPRPQCNHRWEASTQTEALVFGSSRRKYFPEIEILAGSTPRQYEIPEGESFVGRDDSCLINLDNLNVARHHAKLFRQGSQVWFAEYENLGNSLLNGQLVRQKTLLKVGDKISIRGILLKFAVRFGGIEIDQDLADNTRLLARSISQLPKYEGEANEEIPLNQGKLTFGRSSDRDVVLPNNIISSRQAILEFIDGSYLLSDTQSRTGTFVNGKSIIRVRLEPGDRVQMGPFLFHFNGTRLIRVRRVNSLAMVASNLSQCIGSHVLLNSINLVIHPREFVGLLGPSGAGKSTLLDALNGLRPASSGDVFINGEDFYEEYDRLRHLIGYVPQDDIIHRDLTVRQALSFAGKLRLPPDTSESELASLVEETIFAVELDGREDLLISKLSGGQRKRASVGVELLSNPGMLFLDEPTSGLDPATESRLMRRFRQLANQGKTVICTTHVMENVDLFDKIAVLASGGHLAFYGPPKEAKAYFEIEKFTLLYDRLEEKEPSQWKKQYLESPLCKELLGSVVDGKPPVVPVRRRRFGPIPSFSVVGQWSVLTQRYGCILWSDKGNMGLLLGQPFLISAMICLVFRDLPWIYFLDVVAALWFGCSAAAQQIVKELPIYRRERMVNLRVDCYLFSKFIPLAVISFGQCLIMLLVTLLFRGLEGNFIGALFALFLAALNGIALGLLISAFSSNSDKALAIVPLALIPQIIFGGALVPIPNMNFVTSVLSCITVSRWSNQAMEVSLLQGKKVDQSLMQNEAYIRPLWNQHSKYNLSTDEGRKEFFADKNGKVIREGGIFVFDCFVLIAFLGIQLACVGWILRSKDPVC